MFFDLVFARLLFTLNKVYVEIFAKSFPKSYSWIMGRDKILIRKSKEPFYFYIKKELTSQKTIDYI